MLYFTSDYTEGAHEKVLQKLVETNMEHLSGYGMDEYCESAKAKIKAMCGADDTDVHFLEGGTQTNAIVIDSVLSAYEGVVCADSGHIFVHEAGAVEFTGHKVLSLPGECGKLRADVVKEYFENFYADENHEHAVFPGMVYISYPTEYGTLYSKEELKALSEICHRYEIPLYLDGARLGYGLMSKSADVTLEDIASFCDVFYIGGTKVGALCGEAVVFTKNNTPKHFTTIVKQRGALLAKGRLLGIQFETLFEDGLYYEISGHAMQMAEKIREKLKALGAEFVGGSPTNQIFVSLPNSVVEELTKDFVLEPWGKVDENHMAIRICTSWATKEENVDALLESLERVLS